LEADFFREPDLVLPEILSELMEYLAGPFLQFVLGTPPAMFGGQMADQKTASGYAQAKNQAMGVKGIPWMSVQQMWARMLYLAALKASKNPDHAEQILVPVKGQTQVLKLERLTKGKFGAFPDEDSSFPETTSAKRDLLQQLLTIASTNPTIGAQILGDTYNWEIICQIFGFKELQLMEAEAAKKQMREIEELLQGQPMPPTPQEVQAFAQQQEMLQTQHAAAALMAQQQGQPPPPAPEPPKMIPFGMGPDGMTPIQYPEALLKPSIDVDDLDFHQWEGPAGQDWLSTEAAWREINVGRPGPDGDAVPNTLGVENVRLHVKLHLERAAIMAQAQAAQPKPPSESINFADESPAGQAAMNKQAGIQVPAAPSAPTMGMMIPDFELEYRKREIERYENMLETGHTVTNVPIESVIKMLAENLSYRARIDHLIETILRHDFTIPQRTLMPNDMTINKDGSIRVRRAHGRHDSSS
jgi:hypothetical protein